METTIPQYDSIWCELRTDSGEYVSGHGIILRGGAHAPETILAALRHSEGDDATIRASEVQHLHRMPRVKNCSKYDGWGCDLEGEWHGHWFGVKHNPASDCCHTLALPAYDR